MSDQPVRNVLVPNTRDSACAAVLGSFGFLHYVDNGQRLVLHDGERRIEVDIVLSESGEASADTPELVRFSFVGYSEDEADTLIKQYLMHSLRHSDGSLVHSRDQEGWD